VLEQFSLEQLAKNTADVYLEAWRHGLPIVSTFDPDNQIADKGLGIVAKNVSRIADGIRSLYRSPEQRQEMSRMARQFYLKNYTVNTVMTKFEEVFMNLNSNSQYLMALKWYNHNRIFREHECFK